MPPEVTKEGVLFTDGQSRVFLHPPQSYADGYGFHHDVDLIGGPFGGTIKASSYEKTRTLRSFHRQLVNLYEHLRGEAQLPSSYENLKMALKGDGLGHVRIRVDAVAGPSFETLLSFGFSIDQTNLPSIIRDVERFFMTDL